MRIPTWCPFQIQFYFNGHNALAAQLDKEGIKYELADNAFLAIDDFARANVLAELNIERMHQRLDAYARRFCPVIEHFGLTIRWSITQAEFATDVVFRTQGSSKRLFLEWYRVKKRGDEEKANELMQSMRKLPSLNSTDPNFLRLRYNRYADDFLLGVDGPRHMAEEIKDKIKDFLKTIELELSAEKTLITSATKNPARYLGYDVQILQSNDRIKKQAIIVDEVNEFYKGRNELTRRLLADECELCGSNDRISVHHTRKLADIKKRYRGRKDPPAWVKFMMACNRKTVVVCHRCHCEIHKENYDGTKVK